MNRLLVTVDSLRRDHVDQMPRTREFLDDTHDRAFATFTATLGSFQSIFGGEYPTSGHLTDTESFVPTLGCEAVGISTNNLLSERYGYDAGFEDFESPRTDSDPGAKDRIGRLLQPDTRLYQLGVWTWNRYQGLVSRFSTLEKSFRPADEVVEEFRQAVDERDEWFGWLHFMEPHHPYDPEDGPVSRATAQGASRRVIGGSGTESDFELVPKLYRQEVVELDEHLGTLWDALPEDVQVVFCADHGEFLGEGGRWGHPNDLEPTILNVPFGTKNCPELGDVVSLIDIPTIFTGETFGQGTLDRDVAFASVADKKAAMTRDHIATQDGVRTLDGEPADNPTLQRALDRFDPDYVVKEDAVREDLEALGYV